MLSLFVVTIFVITNVFAQTDWVTRKLDDRIVVKFPSKPTITVNQAGMFQGVVYKEIRPNIAESYIVTVTDFRALAGLDSAKVNSMISDPGYHSVRQESNGIHWNSYKKSAWNGYTCFSAKGDWYELASYVFIVYIGTKEYKLFASVLPNDVSLKDKDYFLNSIELNKDSGKSNGLDGKWTGLLIGPPLMTKKTVHYIFKINHDKLMVTDAGGQNVPNLADEKIMGDSLSFALKAPGGAKLLHSGKYYRLGDTISLKVVIGDVKMHSTLMRE